MSVRQAYTIKEFCDAWRISRAHLNRLWKQGRGPSRMDVAGRVLISREAADEWRRSLEVAQ